LLLAGCNLSGNLLQMKTLNHMDGIPFAFSVHPGEILLTEFMEPLGLTAYRLAKELHISAPRVNDLVRGKRGITADTALRLSRYFGNSAQFWIGLQSGHDLWIASKSKSLSKVKPRQQVA
jgi:addiction module HigA family antidote